MGARQKPFLLPSALTPTHLAHTTEAFRTQASEAGAFSSPLPRELARSCLCPFPKEGRPTTKAFCTQGPTSAAADGKPGHLASQFHPHSHGGCCPVMQAEAWEHLPACSGVRGMWETRVRVPVWPWRGVSGDQDPVWQGFSRGTLQG